MKDYKKYIRPYSKTQSMRMGEDIYRLIETIRCAYSNDFVSPTTTDILKIVLQEYVANMKHEDKMLIQRAIDEVLEEGKKETS